MQDKKKDDGGSSNSGVVTVVVIMVLVLALVVVMVVVVAVMVMIMVVVVGQRRRLCVVVAKHTTNNNSNNYNKNSNITNLQPNRSRKEEAMQHLPFHSAQGKHLFIFHTYIIIPSATKGEVAAAARADSFHSAPELRRGKGGEGQGALLVGMGGRLRLPRPDGTALAGRRPAVSGTRPSHPSRAHPRDGRRLPVSATSIWGSR